MFSVLTCSGLAVDIYTMRTVIPTRAAIWGERHSGLGMIALAFPAVSCSRHQGTHLFPPHILRCRSQQVCCDMLLPFLHYPVISGRLRRQGHKTLPGGGHHLTVEHPGPPLTCSLLSTCIPAWRLWVEGMCSQVEMKEFKGEKPG